MAALALWVLSGCAPRRCALAQTVTLLSMNVVELTDVRRLAFFDQPIFGECRPILAAAFHVKDIDYRWERGVRHAVGAIAPEMAS